MSEAADFRLGAVVTCQDGECGELRRVLVNSTHDVISHLAVVPRHRETAGRLVPVHVVESASPQGIRLRCTRAQFEAFDPAEGVEVRTERRIDLESPMIGLRAGSAALSPDGLGGPSTEDAGLTTVRRGFREDSIPDGDGEVSKGQAVHASDGPIGHVAGLVADPSDETLRFILLDEGHLWGEKEVAIPVSAVRFVVDDGVYLHLSRHEVGALPPVDIDRIG